MKSVASMRETEAVLPTPTGTPAPPLRQIAIRSGAYLAVREALGAGVRLAGLVIVTRRIGPTDFGVYMAAAAYSSLAVLLAQMGSEVFLVRLPGQISSRRYDEVFTFLVVSSTLVAACGLALTFLLAPWIRPAGALAPTRVLLAATPVNVLWAPAQAAIERRFAYRGMGVLELGGDVVLYATAVPLALQGAGAWALVAGYLAWQGWLLVGATVLAGLRPRLRWSRATSLALMRHGAGYSLGTWLGGARSALATVVVASFVGARGVGYMGFATKLVTTLNFTERGMHRVGMVAISRARDARSTHLSQALEEGALLQTIVAALPLAAFSLAARWVVPAVFGQQWTAALPVYVLLAVTAVLKMPESVQRVVLFAHGRNMDVALSRAIELALVVSVSAIAVQRFGVLGYGIGCVVGAGATLYTHHATRRLVSLHYRRVLLPILAVVPPALIPLAPMPWAPLLLVPTGVLFTTTSFRREVRWFVTTLRSVRAPRLTNRSVKGGAEMSTNGSSPVRATPFFGLGYPAEAGIVPAPGVVLIPVATGEDRSAPADGGVGRGLIGSSIPLMGPDATTGLPSMGALIARIGRLLGAARGSGWSLVVAAIDVRSQSGTSEERQDAELVAVAAALRAALRFDDAVARLGPTTFLVAVPYLHAVVDAEAIVHHLETAVLGALDARRAPMSDATGRAALAPAVDVAHLSIEIPSGEEADRLVQAVVDRARR